MVVWVLDLLPDPIRDSNNSLLLIHAVLLLLLLNVFDVLACIIIVQGGEDSEEELLLWKCIFLHLWKIVQQVFSSSDDFVEAESHWKLLIVGHCYLLQVLHLDALLVRREIHTFFLPLSICRRNLIAACLYLGRKIWPRQNVRWAQHNGWLTNLGQNVVQVGFGLHVFLHVFNPYLSDFSTRVNLISILIIWWPWFRSSTDVLPLLSSILNCERVFRRVSRLLHLNYYRDQAKGPLYTSPAL